jgi:hypothetical protein
MLERLSTVGKLTAKEIPCQRDANEIRVWGMRFVPEYWGGVGSGGILPATDMDKRH